MAMSVFGSGIALINHWKLIKKYVDPVCCIDNDKEKWGKKNNLGLKCCSIDEAIKQGVTEVLITVGDPYLVEMIKGQLDEKNICYTILTDKLMECGSVEKFPKHLENIAKDTNRKIILMNTPEHDNVGDHLIALSEKEFLTKRFSEYSFYEVTDIEFLWFRRKLKQYIDREDIIIITGGGFLGSLWLYNGELNVRYIIEDYSENKIIIMPQTIYFEENERGYKEFRKTIEVYNKAKNLTILLREKKSYEFLSNNKILKCNYELVPDMAFFYPNILINNETDRLKKLALFCIRKDKESVLSYDKVEKIRESFKKSGYQIKNTSMHSGKFDGLDGRKTQVTDKLKELSGASVIITDTLHCMISAALTGTPCIAFDNLSGKVRNVHEWIKNNQYIKMAPNLEDINQMIVKDELYRGCFKLVDSEQYLNKIERMIRDEK